MTWTSMRQCPLCSADTKSRGGPDFDCTKCSFYGNVAADQGAALYYSFKVGPYKVAVYSPDPDHMYNRHMPVYDSVAFFLNDEWSPFYDAPLELFSVDEHGIIIITEHRIDTIRVFM